MFRMRMRMLRRRKREGEKRRRDKRRRKWVKMRTMMSMSYCVTVMKERKGRGVFQSKEDLKKESERELFQKDETSQQPPTTTTTIIKAGKQASTAPIPAYCTK